MPAIMETAEDTAALVVRAQSGSRSAFEELVRRYQQLVRQFLARILHPAEEIDDLAQEVFLTAFRQLEHCNAEERFAAWLLGIARNQARMYVRGESRRRRRERDALQTAVEQWRLEHVEPSADEQEQHVRTVAALRGCVDDLPEHSRHLVEQFYFAGLSAAALGEALGRKSGAIRMNLLRIRQQLAKCLKGRLGTAFPPNRSEEEFE